MAKPASTVRRVTASLRERDESNLEQVAESAGLTQNDAIRKALATEAFIQETLKAGGAILVREASGDVKEVKFVS
jgi:hypothetical protein